MTPTNNVTRMLDARKIDYTALQLPDEKVGALEAARLLGAPPESVFKTIVVTREKPRPPLLVLVAGTSTVDLKKVAAAVGDKKVHLPTERDAEALTGLQAGGISPLALINKGFRVLIDASAEEQGFIHVSGGQRGLNIRIGVEDLVQLTKARIADVSAPLPPDALE
jgi:Cys-tRNA(Pro)/Cys-tRNA(Cys) deacylase